MRVRLAPLATAVAGGLALTAPAPAYAEPTQPDSYKTICVIQTVDGHRLPVVCVPEPV